MEMVIKFLRSLNEGHLTFKKVEIIDKTDERAQLQF